MIIEAKNLVIVEKEPPLAWIKINRPKAANSLNRELLREICAVCAQLANNNEIHVVSIIGSGTKVFSAGADLIERRTLNISEVKEYHNLIQKTMNTVESLPQTVIAAINGSAYGGGVELALACDLRVMAISATLQLTEVKLGIIPGAGGTQRLPRLIGKSKAKEMILGATPLSAQQGFQFGLINRLVEDEPRPNDDFHQPLMENVRAWAKEIASAAPLALRQAKIAINHGFNHDLPAALDIESKAYMKLLDTKDRLEGLAAFAEKRKPNYVGE